MQLIWPQAGFLGKLPMGRGQKVFLRVIEETAGKGESTSIGLDAAFDQQHMKAGFTQREDDKVNREQDGRRRPAII